MILFHSEQTSFPKFPRRIVKNWIKHVVESCHKHVGEVNVVFCDDAYILEINREYLNHDYFTDVITFNTNNGDVLHGDIIISVDTVNKNAQFYNICFFDELYRVIIHGFLHLIGFDDVTEELQCQMTQEEDKALNILYSVFFNH